MSDSAPPAPWRVEAECLLIRVRVTPRGGRNRVEGLHLDAAGNTALALRVAAAPADGAANKAVLKLIAAATKARISDVTLAAGGTSRNKRIRVDGNPAQCIAALQALLTQMP